MGASPTATAEFRQRAGLEVLTWPVFDALPVEAFVTTRHGGLSRSAHGDYGTLNLGFHVGDDAAAVTGNRRLAAAAAAADLEDFVFARQVHGATAAIVTRQDRGRGALSDSTAAGPADALVTSHPGTVLAVLVADCLPVVLYDPAAHVLACVHAGWRGCLAGVTAAALAAMRTLGAHAADVVAALGPAIAPQNYPVGADVALAARKALGPRAESVIRPTGDPDPRGEEQWFFDLGAASRWALLDAGVPAGNIHGTATATGPGAGTATGPDGGMFFSHRARQPCGRFAAVAKLTAGSLS